MALHPSLIRSRQHEELEASCKGGVAYVEDDSYESSLWRDPCRVGRA